MVNPNISFNICENFFLLCSFRTANVHIIILIWAMLNDNYLDLTKILYEKQVSRRASILKCLFGYCVFSI